MRLQKGLLAVAFSLVLFQLQAQDKVIMRETKSPIAQGKSKFLGNIWSTSQEPNFTDYWNQVTPENAGKWGSVEGIRDQMNWSGLDQAYDLARDNSFPFKLHVLIWGSQQPQWLSDLEPANQLEEITEWFSSLSTRYPDIDIVEVVNEPLHQPPSDYIEALGGSGETGWDWVIESFIMARKYFPNAKLIMNDYGILGNQTNIYKYLKIIDLLQERDLIDHIGIQGHAFTVNSLSSETITSNLDALSIPNLPIFVTELDIDGETDDIQLTRYREVFPALWEYPSVRGITLWGYRPGMWRTTQKAYLINTDGTERPSMTWLKDYVETTDPDTPIVTSVDVTKKIRVYPNPIINNEFTVALQKAANRILVFDLNGRIHAIFDHLVEGEAYSIQLSPGFYIFQFLDELTPTTDKKVIIR